MQRVSDPQVSPDGKWVAFSVRDTDYDANKGRYDVWLAAIAWYGLPLNYLDTWTQQIEKVTLEQVRQAMARKLQPDRMVTVTVGAAPTAPAAAR